MRSLAARAGTILRQDGPVAFCTRAWKWAWNTKIRAHLPGGRYVRYNGVLVPVKRHRIAEWLPAVEPTEPRPNFESGLMNALDETVSPGDTVVTLGGGWGVTAVRAAELVGDGGEVVVYEGAAGSIERVKRTARMNGVADRITVVHAIVGPKVDLMHGADADGADRVDPADLPEADVLEMDIEGSEIDVIRELERRPSWLLVETHGWKGTPTDDVTAALEEKGYQIVSTEIADADRVAMCEERDIHILTARLN